MSGPYRFQGESARSPLDRTPQNLFPAGQPPSFKTNVNRMKTKKWVEARKAAYDGDDWGEYDEFDEYGTAANPEPAEPTGFRQPGQGLEQPGRSFTDPQQARNIAPVARRNSFEAGEESRAFSATFAQPSGSRQVSATHSEISDTPQHRRDFSPSAMPQPLTTRLGGPEPGAPQTGSPAPMSPTNTDKPLPFVRPADIYKRIEEEREKERASLDGSRPSLDSRKDDGQQVPAHSGPPAAVTTATQPLGEPQALETMSAFDNDFWSSGPQLPALANVGQAQAQAQTTSPEGDSSLRAVVDQAFTRPDDQRSMPPTPISKQSDSDFSRSNTTSTTGISPIMSRVPSSATAALKLRSGAEGSTPAIAEEPSGSNTPVSQPTSATMPSGVYQVPQTPHSRNVSSSSIPQTGLATPGSVGSARSPKIEPLRVPSRPQSAIISSMPGSPESAKAELSTFASREADIAQAMRSSPDKAVAGLGAAEKESQAAFLESHQSTQSPIDEAIPRSRSASPSKGRVHELAGKFGEVASSRRGSTQSNLSVQSWERSRENSRPSSPTKSELPSERPAAAREASFRPKLPGQWESYTTSVPTPSEGEKDFQAENAPQGSRTSLPLGEVDLHPTTAKHPVETSPEAEKSAAGSLATDPLATLKAAGAAIGDAIQSSVGVGKGTSGTDEEIASGEEKRVGGDVLSSQPLHLERTASSIASSIPPTPPAKDTPASEDMPPIPPLKEKSPEPSAEPSSQQHTPVRPTMLPKLSTEPSDHDQESDRLRKEIVASLSPAPMEASPQQNRASLQPSLANVNRESSFLPSEYESYWDDSEALSPQREQAAPSSTNQARPPSPGLTSGPTNPVLITRFSWEDGKAAPAEEQASAGAVAGPSVRSPSEGPAAQQAHELAGSHTSSPVPAPEPYFGPDHTAASAPEPLSVSGPIGSALTPTVSPLEPKESLTEPKSLRDSSPVSGLHVVNSALNPEAVDMPPRLNQEGAAARDPPQYNQAESQVSGSARDSKVPEPSQPHPAVASTAGSASAPKSPTSGKPLGFRDILNIKSPSERIQTYNKTREYWASADHGLHAWISAAVAVNPELAIGPVAPIPATNSAARHRHTPSLSLFGKHHGHSSTQSQSNIASHNDPSSPAGANAPANVGSSTTSPEGRPQSSSFANQGRQASLQMQAKGKDLLHTAGVLGGKGMTGAKGLFAKGKSRFRSGGDKVEK